MMLLHLFPLFVRGKKRKESQLFEVIKKTFAWPIPYTLYI